MFLTGIRFYMKDQKTVFLENEGDNWFERNKCALDQLVQCESKDVEYIKSFLKSEKKDINNILEVGCSSGAKLNNLCHFFEARGNGMELIC